MARLNGTLAALPALASPRSRLLLALAATLTYSWWAAGLRPFTWPARVAVALPATAVLALALANHEPRLDLRQWLTRVGGELAGARHRPALLAWGALVGAVVVWELVTLVQQPRADHPTLSWVADVVTGWRPARFLLFWLWLALGADLLRR